ncbi:glutamate racemase [Candidatus Gillettellia adelgis]
MAMLPQVGNFIPLDVVPPCNNTQTLRPTVLVLDSGVGGLSVYQAVRQLLPELHYIYAFDNVAFPYGEKSAALITKRVLAITSAVQQRYPMVIVIIACNTASIISLSALRERFRFPIVGVVPAIKPAVRLTVNGVIGLLATRGTIQHTYIHRLITRFGAECKIELLGSAELVELAEAKLHGETVSLAMLKNILNPWLTMNQPPDTIILGCTHFSFLVEELTLVLPAGVRLVDSSAAIARRSAWLISTQKNLILTQEDNLAYCMVRNKKTHILQPLLKRYGFQRLETLLF